MKIVVIGSVALDTIQTPREKVSEVLGGSAVYFSCAAGFFARTGMVGVVGEDFPPEHLDELKRRGIDTGGVRTVKGQTFRWEGRYLENMNDRETLSVCQNVLKSFDPVLPEAYRKSEFVFLGNIAPCQQLKVLSQIENPSLIGADTMDLWIKNDMNELLKVLRRVDMLVINDSEAKLLTGENNVYKALGAINRLGPGTVVIKRGENGAVLGKDGEVIMTVPAYPLEEFIDPTGAGDVFAGGLFGSLAASGAVNEASLKEAVARGSVMASFCVQGFSLSRLFSVTGEEAEERFRRYCDITSF